jgi:DNA-binding IclR family transcriptional regulator
MLRRLNIVGLCILSIECRDLVLFCIDNQRTIRYIRYTEYSSVNKINLWITDLKSSEPNRKSDYSALVPAVQQAAQILITLAGGGNGKLNLTEICKQVGIHKSKGYSILNTLQQFGFVIRDQENKIYSLGPAVLHLSNRFLSDLNIRELAQPLLHELATSTDSTAILVLISGDHVFVVARDEGTQDIGLTIRLGHRFPLAWGAHGKSILAFLSKSDRDAILNDEKIYVHGKPTNLNTDKLERELSECRASGYSVDIDEMKAGIRAVAAPVFGPRDIVIGSMTVVGTFAQELADEYGSMLAEAAKNLSQMMSGIPRSFTDRVIDNLR